MNKVKIFLAAAGLFAAVILPSCKEKPKNPVAEYGDTMIDAYKGAQDAADAASLSNVKHAIEAYRAANGSYPADLKDVGDLMRSSVDLSKFDYDPATGSVTPKLQK